MERHPGLAALEDMFVEVPEPEPDITEEWARILNWDTTPKDLRKEEVKTLKGFCEQNNTTPIKVNRIRSEETYMRARRKMAQDRGMLNHQCFMILEALYEQAIAGNVSAIKEWNRIYPDEMTLTASKAAIKPGALTDAVQSTDISDLDVEQLEAMLEQLD